MKEGFDKSSLKAQHHGSDRLKFTKITVKNFPPNVG
jgi:hypothetical protein